jgi:hypothetical protein
VSFDLYTFHTHNAKRQRPVYLRTAQLIIAESYRKEAVWISIALRGSDNYRTRFFETGDFEKDLLSKDR